MKALYSIELPYATGGLIIDESGTCIDAPPIFKWMKGRNIYYIGKWVESKNGSLTLIEKGEKND